MGGACSSQVPGGLRREGARSRRSGGAGGPSAVGSDGFGQTKVVPGLSREDVLKQEAERERERNVTRTVDIIWTHFDTDGNGELDQNEFAALVSETLSSSEGGSAADFSPSEMEELMQMIDTDGDGSISRAEFKQLILSLTGLEPEKRDEIAVLSIVMCKAMMFVEAIVNQSSKKMHGLQEEGTESEENELEGKEPEGKEPEGKEPEERRMDSDANIQVEGNASVSVQAQSEQPSSNLAAKRNFSWRPKEVPSNPPTLNKKYTEGQGWELLPV